MKKPMILTSTVSFFFSLSLFLSSSQIEQGVNPACVSPAKLTMSDGYFILLKGLKKGDHTIQYSGEISPIGSVTNVTYKIRVPR